jgi:signal transduction histidine kinase
VRISIRTRLTIWYAVLVVCILGVLGAGLLFCASWGLRRAADQELSSGIDGVATFLRHKLAIHQMDDLDDELREHSALLPRGKMFRVSYAHGAVIYQPDSMYPIPSIIPAGDEIRKENVKVGGRSYQTISRFAVVGPYRFLIQVAVDQTEYMELTRGLAWLLLLSIPFAGLLAAIAGYWMSGRALAPIHQITETTNSIDAASLGRRLPLRNTNDELDRLSTTINHMLDRIARSYERIAQFTADASHELRTPVALIRSSTELMLMEPDSSRLIRHGLSDVLSESSYMTRLIGDLLTLARTGVDGASVSMELLELNESICAVVDRTRDQAAKQGISMDYSPPAHVVPIFGNQDMVERILTIFVDNAVRYTPAGGTIWITTWVIGERCGFIVQDTGIGIAPVNHERIFERFFRVDTARTPRDGGSGLGLSIAKRLIDLHGGTVEVASEIGHGASFTVGFWRIDLSGTDTTSQEARPYLTPEFRINSGGSGYL